MKKLKYTLTRTIIILLLFLIWHITSVKLDGKIPTPLEVLIAMGLEYKVLTYNLVFTLKEALVGLLFSILLVYFFTYISYLVPLIKKAFTPIVLLSQTIPFIAIAPIIVLAFGYGFLPKVIIVILNCFFPLCISLLNGMEDVNQDNVNLLKTMGANKNQIFRYVVTPSLRCYFFSGLKISVTYSIISAVIGEWMGGSLGIGIYITRAKKSYEMNKLIAAVVLICLVSILVSKVVDLIQKKTLRKWSITLVGIFSLLIIFSSEVTPENKNLSVIDFCLDYTPNTNHTGIYVADKLGFFQEEGLKVNILQPPQDGASSLVASGKVQFGIDFQDQLSSMLENPKLSDEIKVVATIVQHNTAVLISKKQNRIKDIYDLSNKKLAISSSPIDQKLLGALARNVKNLEFIITDATDVITTLDTGIDVMCCYYGWDVIAAKKKNIDVNYLFYR